MARDDVIAQPTPREVQRFGGRRAMCAPPPPPPPAGMGSWMLGPEPKLGPPTSGLTLWLKAGAGITLDGSSHVATWADQSGNGNNFISTGTGNGPVVGASINGRTTVNFTAASSQLLKLTGVLTLANLITASAYTTYSVWQYTGSTAFGVYSTSPVVIMDSSAYWGILTGESGGNVTFAAYNYPQYDTTTIATGAAHRFKSKLTTGSVVAVSIDGGSDTTLSTGNVGSLANQPQLGGTLSYAVYFNGPIGEVLVYNRTTSSAEDTAIDAYLKAAWGM